MKKLELKNLQVKKISDQEQSSINGGLLSIGHECSHRNKCARLETRCWGDCCLPEPLEGDEDGTFKNVGIAPNP